MAKDPKSRYWTFILYDDSRPDDWKDRLIRTHLPVDISPCHDRDIKNHQTGEIDKPHRHVMLCFDGPTTRNNVNQISQGELNATTCFQVYSVKGLHDYFVHPEDTCKVPYAEADRIMLNGFDVSNYTQMTSKEEIILVKAIMDQIKKLKINEYCDLVEFAAGEDIQMYDYIIHHTVFFNAVLTSKRNKTKVLKKKPNDLIMEV